MLQKLFVVIAETHLPILETQLLDDLFLLRIVLSK